MQLFKAYVKNWLFQSIYYFLIAMVGLGALCWASASAVNSLDAMTWPTAQGQILSSEIVVNQGSSSQTYKAEIQYHYQVNGKIFSGKNVSFSDLQTSDPADAQLIITRYPVGKPVSVHYNPSDPEQAILEPGFNAGTWILIVIALIFFIFACFQLSRFIRRLRSGDTTWH